MPFEHVLIIANPAAGRPEPMLHTTNRVFREHGVPWEIMVTHDKYDGERYAKTALASGDYDLVMVYGGDGTISDVAHALTGSELPMAPIGGGTGNAIVKELGVSLRLEQALRMVLAGEGAIRKLDCGRTANHDYLMRADVGLLARNMDPPREAKQSWGLLAYAAGLLTSFARPVDVDYIITVDGERHVVADAAACTVANMGHVGGFGLDLGDTISPFDGELDVIVFDNNLADLGRLALTTLKLAEVKSMYTHFRGKQIRVETAQEEPVLLDGDPGWATPLAVEVLPAAVNIFVPGV